MALVANSLIFLGAGFVLALVLTSLSSHLCRTLARILRAQAAGPDAMRLARAEDLKKEL